MEKKKTDEREKGRTKERTVIRLSHMKNKMQTEIGYGDETGSDVKIREKGKIKQQINEMCAVCGRAVSWTPGYSAAEVCGC